MTKLRSLVEETGIGLILVSHLRRPAGEKGWENGMQVTLNSLRGSASIAQLSDMCLSVERDQQGENPNVATVRCLKNRHSGETGIGCYLHYNKETGRMVEVDDPNIFEDAADGSSDF
jgi:twinkle protein